MMISSKIKPDPKNSWDYFLIFISPIVLLFGIIYLSLKLPELPDIIPIHFNESGKADGWGSKHTLWFFPAILGGLHVLFFWLLKHPKQFNYPVAVSPSNKNYLEKLTRRFMRFLLLMITIGFTGILLHILQTVPTGSSDLPAAWLILLIGGPSISSIAYLILAGNKPKT